jgi:hypothetical protein
VLKAIYDLYDSVRLNRFRTNLYQEMAVIQATNLAPLEAAELWTTLKEESVESSAYSCVPCQGTAFIG